jgi:hypothetical protein
MVKHVLSGSGRCNVSQPLNWVEGSSPNWDYSRIGRLAWEMPGETKQTCYAIRGHGLHAQLSEIAIGLR